MKNSQKGFFVPIIVTIIALLTIGGGSYVYINSNSPKKVERLEMNNSATTTISENTSTTTSTTTSVISTTTSKATTSKISTIKKATTTTTLTGTKVQLLINGKGSKDNIQILEKGAPIKIYWTSLGTDQCNIYAKLQPQNRQILLVEPQNKIAMNYQERASHGTFDTLADEDYRSNNLWENPQWLIFYSDCYKAGNPSDAISDIVSVQVVPTATKNNIIIREPTKTVLITGESITIKWSSDVSYIPTVDISLNDRTDSYTIAQIASNIKNKGIYNWIVPNITPGFYKIVISEPTGGPERGYAETALIEFKAGTSNVTVNNDSPTYINPNYQFSTSTVVNQAIVRANLSSIRASAELAYDNNGSSYGQNPFTLSSCYAKSNTLFSDSLVLKGLEAATFNDISIATCVSKGISGKVTSYAVSTPLPEMDGYSWCVDSMGYSKQIIGKITSDSCN